MAAGVREGATPLLDRRRRAHDRPGSQPHGAAALAAMPARAERDRQLPLRGGGGWLDAPRLVGRVLLIEVPGAWHGAPGVIEARPPQRGPRVGARRGRAPQLILRRAWFRRQFQARLAQVLAPLAIEQAGSPARGGKLALHEAADEDVREAQPVQRVQRREQHAAGLAQQHRGSLHAPLQLRGERLERERRPPELLVDRAQRVEVGAQRRRLDLEALVALDGGADERAGSEQGGVERRRPLARRTVLAAEQVAEVRDGSLEAVTRGSQAGGGRLAVVALGLRRLAFERRRQLQQLPEAGHQLPASPDAQQVVDGVPLDAPAAAIEERGAQQLGHSRQPPVVRRQPQQRQHPGPERPRGEPLAGGRVERQLVLREDAAGEREVLRRLAEGHGHVRGPQCVLLAQPLLDRPRDPAQLRLGVERAMGADGGSAAARRQLLDGRGAGERFEARCRPARPFARLAIDGDQHAGAVREGGDERLLARVEELERVDEYEAR